MLAYAPHFLGLAAAAAAEKLKLKKALSSSSSSAGGGVDDGAGKANGKGGAANGKGDGEVSGFVPTGLSIGAVWPDDEEKRKKADVDKHRADPVRVSSLRSECYLVGAVLVGVTEARLGLRFGHCFFVCRIRGWHGSRAWV